MTVQATTYMYYIQRKYLCQPKEIYRAAKGIIYERQIKNTWQPMELYMAVR